MKHEWVEIARDCVVEPAREIRTAIRSAEAERGGMGDGRLGCGRESDQSALG